MPAQPSVQPPNIDELEGMDVSVTTVPVGKEAEHGPPAPEFEQVIPAGELVTVPWPDPASFTESCCTPPPLPPLPLVPVVVPDPPAPTVGPPLVEVGPVVVPAGPLVPGPPTAS
jgi:hypothetical protein